jgi:hypothetical protein
LSFIVKNGGEIFAALSLANLFVVFRGRMQITFEVPIDNFTVAGSLDWLEKVFYTLGLVFF